ncbi:deoxyhypusine synthase [Methanosarcinales archaeon]|nr:MAG: deoxyhypusine synthase [Methanosarcinales archaeon]
MGKIEHINIEADIQIDELLKRGESCAFGLGRLSYAADVLYEMVNEATVFMGLAGAMVPAGMRKIIVELMRKGCIDVFVTTGANLVHDLIEALGHHHIKGVYTESDVELRMKGMSRIYDVYVQDEAFESLEKWLLRRYAEISEEVVGSASPTISISELLSYLGSKVNDKNSILRTAYDLEIPVFCPAIQDSILGLHAWLFNQTKNLRVEVFSDMSSIIEIAYNSEKNGAFLIGGGVPKNFILQTMLVTPDGFDYVIQLTMDRPETGGLSGATLEEAQSWGKVSEDAKTVTVYSDATITLPILVASLFTRLKR